ncbi:hypothetical protein IQ07DRAFT_650508 [Pyrenochaeta sp. DS3sAY3a]|nr:hypothetical protein IQ07DRAFT_650508 [Pyrenochaeta sp. DS3sAY3a]
MATCYNLRGIASYFDGNTHLPCNQTAVDNGGHSSCCAVGDLCLTNGMCRESSRKPSSNWYLRKACTDKTWKDPACPRYCEAIEPTRNTGLIFNCLKPESWCCGYVGGSLKDWPSQAALNITCCSIQDLTFTASDPVVYAKVSAQAKISTLSSTAPTSDSPSSISAFSSAISHVSTELEGNPILDPTITISSSDDLSPTTVSANATSSPESPPSFSSGTSQALPIGLGVGISLGVILLVGIAALFYRRHRRRQSLASLSELDHNAEVDHKGMQIYQSMWPHQQRLSELPAHNDASELAWNGQLVGNNEESMETREEDTKKMGRT